MSIARILIPTATLVIGLTAGVIIGVITGVDAAMAARDLFGPKPEECHEAAPEKLEAPVEAAEAETSSEPNNQ